MTTFFSLTTVAGILLSCLIALPAQAQVKCYYTTPGFKVFNGSMPLQIQTISVPRDLPVGRAIYTQRFDQAGQFPVFECDAPRASLTPYYSLIGKTAADLVTTPVSVNWDGFIYKTGVEGIGIAWFEGLAGAGPLGHQVKAANVISPSCVAWANQVAADYGKCRTDATQFPLKFTSAQFVLFKTGPTKGGTIRGSDLGRIYFSARLGDSEAYEIGALGLTGTINVVTQTCQTSDVAVPMGSHKTSTFGSKGAVSPTVKFSITLRNCPSFDGLYAAQVAPTIASQDGLISPGGRVPKALRIRIDPLSTPIDASSGILSLTGGAGMAKGVGVQILDAVGTPIVLSAAINPNAVLASVIDISFGARYVQTEDTVTPGKANSVATYTIIYQ